MKPKLLAVSLLAFTAIVLVWIALGAIWKAKTPSARQEVEAMFRQVPPPKDEAEAKEFAQLKDMITERIEEGRPYFAHRIDFYEIVRDEMGNPVQGAQTRYNAPNMIQAMSGEGSTQPGPLSAADGTFAITGKVSAGITVTVEHPDYYATESSRWDRDYNHTPPEARPTRDKPVEFVLRRKGVAEPLLRMDRNVRIPKDGTPATIGLSAKDAKDLVVRVWTDPGPAPYAWRMKIEVPGGGLLEHDGKFQFLAPEDGYAPTFEFAMPVEGTEGGWRGDMRTNFFVRLPGARYAKLRFRMTSRGDHFAEAESYYNPTGSRNLEYDPAKQIRS